MDLGSEPVVRDFSDRFRARLVRDLCASQLE